MKKMIVPLVLLLMLLAACAAPGAGGQTPEPIEPTESPTPEPGYTLEWLAGLPPHAILLQHDFEPTFFRMEANHPFGRIPNFTLYADGTLVYPSQAPTFDQMEVMIVQLSPEAALALVKEVMDIGFEGLEDYLDFCMPQDDGTSMCIADAAFTILRATLADGEFREVKSYANFSNDPAALEEIHLLLTGYSNPEGQVYRPERASLFYSSMAGELDVVLQPWPLDSSLVGGAGEALNAFVLEGEALKRLIEAMGRNTGDAYFDVNGHEVATYLVPWLPYADHRAELEAAFPPPTLAPVPEPVFEIAEKAREELSRMLGIPVDEIKVSAFEQVDWPDGCLGIPFPDVGCLMAITPGYRLTLEAGGVAYEFRSNLDGGVLYYADPNLTKPGEGTDY